MAGVRGRRKINFEIAVEPVGLVRMDPTNPGRRNLAACLCPRGLVHRHGRPIRRNAGKFLKGRQVVWLGIKRWQRACEELPAHDDVS